MAELTVIHSGNPDCINCQMVLAVARNMKKIFTELKLNIYTTGSEEARKFRVRRSTNVLFNEESIPFHISINEKRMKAFLSGKLSE